jgi:hypothetical protein
MLGRITTNVKQSNRWDGSTNDPTERWQKAELLSFLETKSYIKVIVGTNNPVTQRTSWRIYRFVLCWGKIAASILYRIKKYDKIFKLRVLIFFIIWKFFFFSCWLPFFISCFLCFQEIFFFLYTFSRKQTFINKHIIFLYFFFPFFSIDNFLFFFFLQREKKKLCLFF